MRRLVFPAIALLTGLAVSQGLFTVLVHFSNIAFHEKLLALGRAGYLVIPNDHVMPSLTRWEPAFYGGVFFTITIGAGMTFLGFLAAWGYKRLFPGSRIYPATLIFLWIAIIAACNANGLNLPATVVVILVPVALYAVTMRWMPAAPAAADKKVIAAHVMAIVIAVAAWVPHLEKDVFINIRDHILLSNPVGKSVNAFYYDYTLYPTQLFNALDQKLLKACAVTVGGDTALHDQLVRRLIDFDYLPVAPEAPHDISIQADRHAITLSQGASNVWRMKTPAFLADTGSALREFSDFADAHQFFRKLTFFSLVSAFPLCFYVIAHTGFAMLLGFVQSPPLRSIIASGCCLAIALTASVPFYGEPTTQLNRNELNDLLDQKDWRQQRNALKYIAEHRKNPLSYNLNRALVHSPHVPVRYWLAQSLSASGGPEARKLLTTLLDDPQPNVVCMAYYSLGKTGNRRAIAIILDRIDDIPHWYTQRYAYNSLRRLGWKQTPFDTLPHRLP